jgi:hypothetical protein
LEVTPPGSRSYLQAKIVALDVTRITQALAETLKERLRVW